MNPGIEAIGRGVGTRQRQGSIRPRLRRAGESLAASSTADYGGSAGGLREAAATGKVEATWLIKS